MQEKDKHIPVEAVIGMICESGPDGYWIDLESYSQNELQQLMKLLDKTIEEKGDQLTQQLSPISQQPLTFKNVLSKVKIRVQHLIDEI